MESSKSRGIVHEGERIILTRYNWRIFKEALWHYALEYGSAGLALIKGEEQVEKPSEDIVQLMENTALSLGLVKKGQRRRQKEEFEKVNEETVRQYQVIRMTYRDEKEAYEKYQDKKRQLISCILQQVSAEIKDKLITEPNYEDLVTEGDIIGFYRLMEKTVVGSGNISVFHLTTKFFRMQMGDPSLWASYFKEWTQLVSELNKQGKPEEVLEAIFLTHLVLSVDQQEFREILSPIYGTNKWPTREELLNRMIIYARNKDVVNTMHNEGTNTEGRVGAYGVFNRPQNGNQRGYQGQHQGKACYNCGNIGHIKEQCPQAPAKCGICGRKHMTKFCLLGKDAAQEAQGQRRQEQGEKGQMKDKGNKDKDTKRRSSDNKKDKSKQSNKAGGGTNKRFQGYAAKYEESEEENTGDSGEDNEDDSEDEEGIGYYVRYEIIEEEDNEENNEAIQEEEEEEQEQTKDQETFCGIIHTYEDNEEVNDTRLKEQGKTNGGYVEEGYLSQQNIIKNNSLDDTVFILDTGCRKYNICNIPELVRDTKNTTISVVGVSGTPMKADGLGHLPFCGPTLVLRQADANLISVAQLLKRYPGSRISITAEALTITDAQGVRLLQATSHAITGFWTCTYADLKHAEKQYDNAAMLIGNTNAISNETADNGAEDDDQTLPDPAHHLPPLPPPPERNQWTVTPVPLPIGDRQGRHLSAEEQGRASEAWKLCTTLGHPGHDKIAKDLDNNCYRDTHLTSSDVRNAVNFYGPCPACMEAKMRPPPEPTSTSPPANNVGEAIHADIWQFKAKTLGGHTHGLIAVDEKTGYVFLIPMPTKHTTALMEACKEIINFFHSYGHTVKRLCTDSENNLLALKGFLAANSILYVSLPPGLHEKRIERYVQTIKRRRDAMLASLTYVLPPQLEAEIIIQAVALHNRTSNKASRPYTPLQLVTKERPIIPPYYFGQIGMFYNNRSRNNPHSRADWGIYLGLNGHHKSLRAYFPASNAVYVRRKFQPHHVIPPEWNLPPRLPQPGTTTKPTQVIQTQGALPGPLPRTPFGPDNAIHVDLPVLPPTQVIMRKQKPTQNDVTVPPPPPLPPPPPVTPAAPLPAPQQLPQAQEGDDQEGEDREGDLEAVVRRNPTRAATKHKGWKDGRVAHIFKVEDLETRILRDIFQVYRISFKKAMKMREENPGIMDAAIAEIDNLWKNKVFEPVRYRDLKEGEKAIPVHMFFTFKTKADGSFDKIKARMVVNGNLQDESTIEDTFSPTVNSASVFTLLAVAARRGLTLSSHDVKGAFLLTPVPEHKRIFVQVTGELKDLMISLHPELEEFVTEKNALILRLRQFLYGCAEAPHQFNKFLVGKLKIAGYEPIRADSCIFVSIVPDTTGQHSYVAVHVDDMLLAAACEIVRRQFEKAMEEFCELSSQRDGHLSYLGLNINQDIEQGIIRVDQSGFAKSLMERSGCSEDTISKAPVTPSTSALISHAENEKGNTPLNAKEHKDYRSLVMAIMFLARMTRPDLLFTVTVLAQHCNNPTWQNMNHVYRVLHYINATLDYGLEFRKDQPLRPVIYADASHALHETGHGHGGIILSLGTAPLLSRSFKLPIATKSSSESELVALDEAAAYAVWLRLLLYQLKVFSDRGVPPVKIYQDNMSTIAMAQQEIYNFRRSKHMLVKENFVKERLDLGDVMLQHLPTDQMLADILTKPVGRQTLVDALQRMSVTFNSSNLSKRKVS